MNLTNYVENGYTYTDYLRKIEDQLFDLEKLDKENEMIEYYSLNLKRIDRLNRTFTLSDEQKQSLQSLQTNFKILVISEGWCGDAAQILPVVNVIAKEAGIELKIVLRDQNLELIDAYLTDGGRSIPIFIGVNENGEEIFKFGPRPSYGMKLLEKFRADENYSKDEFHKDLQLWYAKDKGNAIFDELVEKMKK
ncbi:MAG: thioredoxin family protein [Weeksellaceae bacterium]|jgi:hypothetical protein|nr:thioredoxin family protein [Weeksellaceae bacterium]MDX9705357.1 thioredoxin family protein [Weeksellaceae bacterium]